MKILKNIAICVAIVSSTCTMAHASNPSITYLEKKYKISNAEATDRINIQNKVIELSEKLNTLNDPDYADLYIQHDPVFKIVIMFADKKDRFEFLKSLDPKMQKYVQIRSVNKSRKVFNSELDEINNAVRSTNIPFSSVFDLEKQKFIITVENNSNIDKIKKILPKATSNETLILTGKIPKIQAAPTGVQSGDRLYGGNPIWTNANATGLRCTLGYAVNYTSGGVAKKGILTAGHCDNAYFANMGNHDVLLYSPIVEKPHQAQDGIADKYDYQIWETTGLTVDNKIKYVNSNGIPEFSPTRVLNLTSIVTFLNQKKGMIVCKSGAVTGITCGEILNGNATHDGVAGWIEVGNSNQPNISAGGDSGGPWFLYPGKSSTISGVGIHIAGSDNPDIAIYMPIDYIDDHLPSVNTIKQ